MGLFQLRPRTYPLRNCEEPRVGVDRPVARLNSVSYHFGVWKQTKSGVWVPKRLLAETAARPHWITVILGLLSPVIGIAALVIARQALITSQQTLKVGQRAYLNVVEVKYADGDLQFHIKNSGNTPAEIYPLALKVVAMDQIQFLEVMKRALHGGGSPFGELMRLSKRLALISKSKDIAGKEDGWLNVACDKHHLTDWNGLPDKIVVAALLRYRDVFHEPHVVTWGWLMDKLQVTTELDHFAVELLLVPRFPSDVGITLPERLDEFDPRLSSPQK